MPLTGRSRPAFRGDNNRKTPIDADPAERLSMAGSVEEAPCDGRVGVNTAVAQKGPVSADGLDPAEVEVREKNLLCFVSGGCQHPP